MSLSPIRNESKVNPIEAHRPTLGKEELEAVLDCLINEQLGSGSVVSRFEKTFAGTFGYRHVLAVNSLAAAYHLALLALEAAPGDHVFMSALAPLQACDATVYIQATPVLFDVCRDSFHPDPDAMGEALKKQGHDGDRPVTLILDHTFGSVSPLRPADWGLNGLNVIEDVTGLIGTEIDGDFSGRLGDISICGLAADNLMTTGNGALIITSRTPLFKKMESLRYGARRLPGQIAYDYRLGDYQAAMGLSQLGRLGVTNERRRKIGHRYLDTLRSTKHETYFRRPDLDGFLRFPVVINRNHEEVVRYFNSLKIEVTRAAELPLHHLLDAARMEYPNSERLYQKAVNIPIYPNLTAGSIERVTSALRGLL